MRYPCLTSSGLFGASCGTFDCTTEHWRLGYFHLASDSTTSASSACAAFIVAVEPHSTLPYVAIAPNTAGPASAASAMRYPY